jgi:hypothetical protein
MIIDWEIDDKKTISVDLKDLRSIEIVYNNQFQISFFGEVPFLVGFNQGIVLMEEYLNYARGKLTNKSKA